MTTPTQPTRPTPAALSENMQDTRYQMKLNVFCLKCKQDKRRLGGVMRNRMFFICADCK